MRVRFPPWVLFGSDMQKGDLFFVTRPIFSVTVWMTKTRKSAIWKSSKEEFQTVCSNCSSLADIMRHFGVRPEAGNYQTLKRRIKEDQTDISHIRLGLSNCKGRFPITRYTEEKARRALEIGSITNRSQIKILCVRYNILDNKICAICAHPDKWNDKPLVMQLDHIDGNSSNNLLSNFRFVCPNCHTQTETHSGKRLKYESHFDLIPLAERPGFIKSVKKVERFIPPSNPVDANGVNIRAVCKCGKHISPKAKMCHRCAAAVFAEKSRRFCMSKEILEKAVWEMPTSALAKQHGISDQAIGKRCRGLGIVKPPRGYWNRRAAGEDHEAALKPQIKGTKCPRKFSLEQVLEIRRRIDADQESFRAIARAFGCGHQLICQIRDGKRYRDYCETTVQVSQ